MAEPLCKTIREEKERVQSVIEREPRQTILEISATVELGTSSETHGRFLLII